MSKKLKLNREELAKALEAAKQTISIKSGNKLLQNFCFKLTGKVLHIISTDAELATVARVIPIEANCEELIFTVPGDKLVKIVNASKEEFISFKIEDSRVTIKTPSYKSTLASLVADEFPSIEDFESEGSVTMNKDMFLDSIRRIAFAVNKNAAQVVLMSVVIRNGKMVAADNTASAIIDFPMKSKDEIVIPSTAIEDLVKVLSVSLSKEMQVARTQNWLLFKTEDELFLTRLSASSFPAIEKRVFKQTKDLTEYITFDADELREVVQRVSITSDSESYAMKFEIKKDRAVLSCSDDTGNESKERMKVDTNIEEASFIVNYQYVLSIIRSVYKKSVTMKLATSEDDASQQVPIHVSDEGLDIFLLRIQDDVEEEEE